MEDIKDLPPYIAKALLAEKYGIANRLNRGETCQNCSRKFMNKCIYSDKRNIGQIYNVCELWG